jgi:hypothetical protein
MATGRHLQLTKQAGEYLVAAELCRRGFISTTFTGNVPHYDIIASDEKGRHVPVQVKTLASGSWQLDIRNFAEVELKDGKQYVGKPLDLGISNLVCSCSCQPTAGILSMFWNGASCSLLSLGTTSATCRSMVVPELGSWIRSIVL